MHYIIKTIKRPLSLKKKWFIDTLVTPAGESRIDSFNRGSPFPQAFAAS